MNVVRLKQWTICHGTDGFAIFGIDQSAQRETVSGVQQIFRPTNEHLKPFGYGRSLGDEGVIVELDHD